MKELMDLKNKFNDSDRKPEEYKRTPRITNGIAKMEEKKNIGRQNFPIWKELVVVSGSQIGRLWIGRIVRNLPF